MDVPAGRKTCPRYGVGIETLVGIYGEGIALGGFQSWLTAPVRLDRPRRGLAESSSLDCLGASVSTLRPPPYFILFVSWGWPSTGAIQLILSFMHRCGTLPRRSSSLGCCLDGPSVARFLTFLRRRQASEAAARNATKMGESQQHARKVLLGLKTLSDYLASCPDVKNSAAARSRIAEQRSQLSNFSSQLGELHSRLPMCDEIMKLDGRWLTHHEYVEMAERITSQAMEAARRVEAGELEITGALRGLRTACGTYA